MYEVYNADGGWGVVFDPLSRSLFIRLFGTNSNADLTLGNFNDPKLAVELAKMFRLIATDLCNPAPKG